MKKIIAFLLVAGMSISLIACGKSSSNDKGNKKANASKAETKLEYYEECSTLPKAESLIDADYQSKTSSVTGDNAGLTVYNYVGKSGESVAELISSYASALTDEGFTTKEEYDASVSVIENELIIATVKEEEGVMKVFIIPENLRMSAAVKTISIGDVITTDSYEFTLKNVEFTYELLPQDTSSVYASYSAESGKVYIHVAADVKNTMQRDMKIEELFTASAIYDGQYSYSGFNVVDSGNNFDWVESYVAATPLETCGAHTLIECPVEVDSSGKPVTVTITIGNTNYEYSLR